MATPDALKALDIAVKDIEKSFGVGSIARLGDKPKVHIQSSTTGAITLDIALGIGGVPRGRIVEIYGPESSGKTTICYNIIAGFQARGEIAAFIDSEHALDPNWAAKAGVNVDDLYVSQPDDGEQALEITERLINSGAVGLVVVDSVAALTPRSEIEGDMGGQLPGLHARLMSQALRKLVAAVSKSNTTLIFTNQLRKKIGVMFGSPEVTTGGESLKFYASQRLDVRRIETLKEGTDPVGNKVRVKVVKNKVAPPFQEAIFEIRYDSGVDQVGMILDLATEDDINLVTKSGSFFKLAEDIEGEKADTNIGQGGKNAKQWLVEHPAVLANIEARIRSIKLSSDEEVDEVEVEGEEPDDDPALADA